MKKIFSCHIALLVFAFCMQSCYNETRPEENIETYQNEESISSSKVEEVDERTLRPEEIAEYVSDEEIFTVVEDMPLFGDCGIEETREAQDKCHEQALVNYLGGITYPPMARDNDIQGKVYISFIISSTGEVNSAFVAKGTDELLDNAALRHIQNMPDWTPGRQGGEAVNVQYVVPINFVLG